MPKIGPEHDTETRGREIASLDRILGSGVPGEALAFYGRWWQLETWLREVAYTELRARYGKGWTARLHGPASRRAIGEKRNSYMATADSEELLAYADVSDLFKLIENEWPLFEPPLRRWQGTTDELRELRNRNAHCRRPHRDDVARVEQTLRDIEPGARTFYGSYLDTEWAGKTRDPLSRGWVYGRHADAARLLKHAQRQYETRFTLTYSVRPWAEQPEKNHVSGRPGGLWHANWTIGGRELNVASLWEEILRQDMDRGLLVHVLCDICSVTATFATLDDPKGTADAIGHVFDAILMTSRPTRHPIDVESWEQRWLAGAELLPGIVQVNSPLTLFDHYNPSALSIFGA